VWRFGSRCRIRPALMMVRGHGWLAQPFFIVVSSCFMLGPALRSLAHHQLSLMRFACLTAKVVENYQRKGFESLGLVKCINDGESKWLHVTSPGKLRPPETATGAKPGQLGGNPGSVKPASDAASS